MDFKKRYASLNKAQKQAVDTIEGPVLVIAGPGTGKTELLAVRAANILKNTDVLPENILCLTFTDSGANAMRGRLTEIIGKDAYKVAIHTFHSFGAEVINQNGQYFYQGSRFMPADGLSSYEILNQIFKELEYNNPLSSKINDEFTHLPDSLTVISELKRSGLTSDELLAILNENDAVIEKAEQLLSPVFESKISKQTVHGLKKHIEAIRASNGNVIIETVTPLSQIIADSLEDATVEAETQNSTKPITAWRNHWFKKNAKNKYILKSNERQIKLKSLSFVYEKYLTRMQQASLYDFDDMILRVVHAMEVFDDLRFDLQEKYQYIMVDEFQDTNMAQMRILHNLTNNIAIGDMPNVLVVGDDDQAIYNFQGADISNIINFRTNYPKAKLIVLTDNYRSSPEILSGSRQIILQGQDRLENVITELDKQLTAHSMPDGKSVKFFEAETSSDERRFIVDDIKSKIEAGEKPGNIALLMRRHREINSILPYFSKAKIAVNYEKRDNVLELAPIKFIEKLSRLLIDIAKGRPDEVNINLPEILAHEAWGFNPLKLWKLSVKAYDSHEGWLDVMADYDTEFTGIHDWLIQTASKIEDAPLEQILDIIIGKPDSDIGVDNSGFRSPLYEYYFSDKKLNDKPGEYLLYLESLRTIRARLREYQPDKKPTLESFIQFIALSRKIGSTISVIRHPSESCEAVNLMTAHKSKGMEFNVVYVMNAVDTVWGQRARSRNRLIGYPENLPLAPAGENQDERLRLFYVAITRAKKQLNISYSLADDSGKDTMKASFLLDTTWPAKKIIEPDGEEQLTEAAELAWYQPLVDPTTEKMRDLLLPRLNNYKLSVTHLNNFLDVTKGGPTAFLVENLLRFPMAKSPNAAFGTAIHSTLQNTHSHLTSTGKKQAAEDIISVFEQNLRNQHMKSDDFRDFLQKGSDILHNFFEKKYDTFSPDQCTELNLSSQHSIVGEAHVTGKLDVAQIDKTNRTIFVTDYKTGKPSLSWTGKTDYEKVKLHKYRQQLLFYKLLIENSRDYHIYSVDRALMQFIEPLNDGEVVALDIRFDKTELDRLKILINAVWRHITKLDLPDTSKYEQNYKGILAFEQDLIDGNI
jgi:DNA helicase-2/ATP-dependent DNA helicase PcrA